MCHQKLETLLVDNIYNSSQVFEDTLYFRKLSIQVIVKLVLEWDKMISDAKGLALRCILQLPK